MHGVLKNYYLLFHKCGNNYVKNIHEIDRETPFVSSIEPNETDELECQENTGVLNVRCRNFGSADIEAHGFTRESESRFLIFTREPASFILSAVKYHLRGEEEWARTLKQIKFDNMSLTDALNNTSNDDERYIIVMKQFKHLYEKQASLANYFQHPSFMRLKVEDLFTSADPEYYRNIAKHFRLEGNTDYINALMQSSPAYKKELPKHSTGAFRVNNALAKFGGKARSYYEEHFAAFAEVLGY